MKLKNLKLMITKKGLTLYCKGTRIYLDRILLALLILGLLISIPFKKEKKTITLNSEVTYLMTSYHKVPKVTEEPKKETKVNHTTNYRMTYYYPGDATQSGSCTASGKCAKDFEINEKGWYTYKGKLVVATAHSSLKKWESYKNSTQQTYKLYDELTLTIQGKDYEAIVLDKCGACMKSAKIDLFVKDKSHGLDTHITVKK